MSDADADLTALIADVRAKEGHACGYSLIDTVSGEYYPCDRPGVSWRWYQSVEHEDMLDRACAFHENAGGLLVVRLVDAVERLARERDDARAENERLRREYTPCDLDLLSRAEVAEAEVADLRTRLADAEATTRKQRRKIDDALTTLRPLTEAVEAECQPYDEMCHGHDMHDDECALVGDLNRIRRALDGPQDGGYGR